MYSGEKVDAVYDLRAAVEEKVRLEVALETHPSQAAKDALLDATLKVEDRTQHAIEVCHSCGLQHCEDAAGCDSGGQVIEVDFRQNSSDRV